MVAKEIIVKGSKWNIGNGLKINIWDNKWIPRPESFKVFSPRLSQHDVVQVSDMIDTNKRSWDIAKVRSTFLPQEAKVVLGIPVSSCLLEDSIVWAWTTHGKFTINSAYVVVQKWLKERIVRLEIGGSSNSSRMGSIRKLIWQLNCPNKIKHFMWRTCKNILPTKNRLMIGGVGSEDYCALCGHSETMGHTLWGCQYAKDVWNGTKIRLPWMQESLNELIDIVWEIKESYPNVD